MKNYHLFHPRLLSKALGIFLVVALAAGVLPTAGSAAVLAAKCTPSYEVRRGDTLAKIGDRTGFTPSQVVYANDWKSPYTIYVGQKICIPTNSVSGLAKLDSKYANAPAAYFTAGRNAANILVYPYTYPKTTVLVKAGTSDAGKNLVNIGQISNLTNGTSYRFKLPASLQNAKNIKICLKDRTSSYLQCAVLRTGP